jgi:hypothetical protein
MRDRQGRATRDAIPVFPMIVLTLTLLLDLVIAVWNWVST